MTEQQHGFVHALHGADVGYCSNCGQIQNAHPVHSLYNLRAVPDGVVPLTEANREDITLLKWGGALSIPAIGDRVRINFNGLGHGQVTHYFYEHGYLGVMVELEADPEWHRKQTEGRWHHGYAMVFGTEIENA